MRHLIIAGHYVQAKRYANRHGYRPTEWIYVVDDTHVYGRIGSDGSHPGYEVHFVGSYWENRMFRNPLVRAVYDKPTLGPKQVY